MDKALYLGLFVIVIPKKIIQPIGIKIKTVIWLKILLMVKK
jgi:hypothetical protein